MPKLLVKYRRRSRRYSPAMWKLCEKYNKPLLYLVDLVSTGLLIVLTISFPVYGMLYVLPEFLDTSSLLYKLHWLLSFFIVHNILGNMIACKITDTSLAAVAPARRHPKGSEAQYWRMCHDCQQLEPPRSWHCFRCSRCILKRDHHCNFTGCCIGHTNHRYFIGMVVHLAIGATIMLIYNILDCVNHRTGMAEIPLILVFKSLGVTVPNTDIDDFFNKVVKLMVLQVNAMSFCFIIAFMIGQLLNCSRGSIMHRSQDRTYDLGVKKNFELVLGRGMWYILLSPLIYSPLPHDGLEWRLTKQCA